MSSTNTVPVESKSAKKRKAKAEATAAATDSPAGRASPTVESVNGHGTESTPATENSYLKELAKNIRNLHKKIGASSKADQVVQSNPGVSLDELVAQKKLNADQKAQLTKKPQLQSQVSQLEEQYKQCQTIVQEMQEAFEKEKAALVESHEAELAQVKQEAADQMAETPDEPMSKETTDHALAVVTGFLHTAAAKRQLEDQDSEESKAFEGALLLVYQGNSQSLHTLKSLVEGSDEKVTDTEGNALEYTYAQIKEAALKDAAALIEEPAETTPTNEEVVETEVETSGTDPTIANAGLTELEDTTIVPITANGDIEPEPEIAVPEQASAGEEGANAAAEQAWDPQSSMVSTQTTEDFVMVARDPAETETGTTAPAVQQSTSNWADETAAEEKAVTENDGFEQVKRERGRGRGGHRGGRGYDGRGRGRGRGEYRGRARGDGRGGRGRGDRAPQAPQAATAS